jgi:hypothetical protein
VMLKMAIFESRNVFESIRAHDLELGSEYLPFEKAPYK